MKYPEDFINKIIQGDCLEVMKDIPDDSVDFVFTSPPYNFGKEIKSDDFKYEKFNDNKTIEEYFDWSVEVIKQLLRVTKNEVFYNIQMISGNKVSLLRLLGQFSNQIKDIMIWDKMRAEPAICPGVLNSQFEFILVLSKSNNTRKFSNDSFRGTISNIVNISKVTNNSFSKENSATFPIKLPSFIISSFTKENDTILDPFIGTGTTALACRQLNRQFIGIDLVEDMCKISQDRLKQETLL